MSAFDRAADRALGALGAALEGRRGRRTGLGVVVASVALAALGLPGVRIDNSNEGTFQPGDPLVAAYRAFKAEFGNDEIAVVALTPPEGDAFDEGFLAALGDLEQAIRRLDHVRRTTSLRSVRYVEGTADEIASGDFIPALPPRADARAIALAHPRYAGTYVTRSGDGAAIVIDTAVPDEDNEGKLALARALRALLAEPRFAALAPRLAGAPIFEAAFDERTSEEGGLLFGLAFLASGVFLAATFRSARAAAVPLATAACAAIATLGWMGHLGQPVSMYSVILPALLITVGVADAVHLVEGVLAHGPREALRRHGLPCAVTALTTAAGFLAFATSEVRPLRVLGTFAGLGVMLCFAYAVLLAPWASAPRLGRGRGGSDGGRADTEGERAAGAPRAPHAPSAAHARNAPSAAGAADATAADSAGRVDAPSAPSAAGAAPRPPAGVSVDGTPPDGILARIAAAAVERSGLVLAGAALLAVAAAVGIARVRIDTFWLDSFRAGSELRRSFAHIDERFDGSFSLELLVDAGRPDGLHDPALLGRLAAFEDRIRRDPAGIVGSVYGPTDLLAEVHAALAAGTEAALDPLPKSPEGVAQRLLVVDREDIDELFDLDRRIGRIHLRVRSRPSSDYLALVTRIEAIAREEGLAVETTGVTKLFSALAGYVTASQVEGFALAFVAIAALLALLLRSLRLGLLALVPNLLPIAVTLGLMGALDIRLDMMTVLIACVALGISDDDTVHFFTSFRAARARGLDAAAAARATAAALARPAAAMSLALTAGFLVFAASSTLHLVRFGVLTAVAIALAFACEIVVTPALLARFGGGGDGGARGGAPGGPAAG